VHGSGKRSFGSEDPADQRGSLLSNKLESGVFFAAKAMSSLKIHISLLKFAMTLLFFRANQNKILYIIALFSNPSLLR
jgi:hypothetical protein